ncbi:hypothetical protein JOF48_003636 [Arthrobacter stackebrandtii]|uniref:Uncharacterized protein n=1 Tax=Arthrobacter stackebrandtii TaxID=272161 RepID=A0ABS4Z2A6_9MICC|nr:hypothetical protein [Arthrobacter stackebrandtii]
MSSAHHPFPIIVRVDGSESSVAETEMLASGLRTPLQALLCWNYPRASSVPHGPGSFDFRGAAQQILDTAVEDAFGLNWPKNLTIRLEQGLPGQPSLKPARMRHCLCWRSAGVSRPWSFGSLGPSSGNRGFHRIKA